MFLLSFLAGTILSILKEVIIQIKNFYIYVLPYTLNYIGIPLFVLGLLVAIGFVGSNILMFILFMVLGYFFIKGTLFSSPYSKSYKAQVSNVSNNDYAKTL
jgi:hypothetical protein